MIRDEIKINNRKKIKKNLQESRKRFIIDNEIKSHYLNLVFSKRVC